MYDKDYTVDVIANDDNENDMAMIMSKRERESMLCFVYQTNQKTYEVFMIIYMNANADYTDIIDIACDTLRQNHDKTQKKKRAEYYTPFPSRVFGLQSFRRNTATQNMILKMTTAIGRMASLYRLRNR